MWNIIKPNTKSNFEAVDLNLKVENYELKKYKKFGNHI